MRGNSEPVDDQPNNDLEEIHSSAVQQGALLDKLSVLLSDDLTEGVNPDYLKDIFQEYSMRVHDGESDTSEYAKVFITLLDRALSLKSLREKISQIDLFSKVYPHVGPTVVPELNVLIPKLVTNLVTPEKELKRSTLNALHVCIKHSSNRVEILRSLVKHGVEVADTKTRTEIMVSLPVLLTADVASEDLFDIVLILVRRLVQSSVKSEHNPPSLLCLERLKEVLKESFGGYIQRMPKQLQLEYKMAMESHRVHIPRSLDSRSSETSHLPKSRKSLDKDSQNVAGNLKNSSNSVKYGKDATSTNGTLERQQLRYGLIPEDVMAGLMEEQNWRIRSLAMDNFAAIVRNITDMTVIIPYLKDLFALIVNFCDDSNFKIQMLSLEVVADLIGKAGTHIRPQLNSVMTAAIRKFGDGKNVVKKAVYHIILRLMQSVGPSRPLECIYPLVDHRNSKVRMDTIDLIIIALLTFPSSEFDLAAVSQAIAPLLIDNKRKIRQGVLECYSLLAQALGQGKLNPIVAAVDTIELRPGGDGVMDAVQARLARRQLPKLKPDGLVAYAVAIPVEPAKESTLFSDIEWILKAAGGGGEGSAKSQLFDGQSAKRYYSAGKRRLPWELTNEAELEPRKTVGSAPLRPKPPPSSTETRISSLAHDAWTVGESDINNTTKSCDTSYLGKYVLKNKIPGPLTEKSDLNRSESQGSYFKLYKNKMRRLKQAGLQADQNMMVTISSQGQSSGGYSLLYKKGTITGKKGVNEDNEFFSKSGCHSLSPIRPPSVSPDSPEEQCLSNSWSGTGMFEQFDGVKAKPKRQDLQPIVNELSGHSPRTSESPVCMKPQLARSASRKRNQSTADKTFVGKEEIHRSGEAMRNVSRSQVDSSFLHGNQGSPFDSKPRLVRTPSGKLSSGKWKSLDRLTPITKPDKSVKSDVVESSVRPADDTSDSTAVANTLALNERHLSGSVELGNVLDYRSSSHDSHFITMPRKEKSPVRKSLADLDGNNNWNSSEKLNEQEEDGIHTYLRKSSSGLSKSALERAEKKRQEEKKKWEIEHQLKEERRMEYMERKKQREQEKQKEIRQKRQEVARSLEEIKKLENLIISKQQEEFEKRNKRANESTCEVKAENVPVDDRAPEVPGLKREDDGHQLREERLKLEAEKKRLEHEIRKSELQKIERRTHETEHTDSVDHGNLNSDQYTDAAFHTTEHSLIAHDNPAAGAHLKDSMSPKLPHPKRFESFDIDTNDMKAGNGYINSANLIQRRSGRNNGYGKPPISDSPRPRRKAAGSPPPKVGGDGSYGIGSAGSRSCVDPDIGSEQLMSLSNPDWSFKEALKQLGANAEDWDLKCQGLLTIRCLAAHHPEILQQQLHVVAIAVATEVKNLRSQVTRTSLVCLADMCHGLGRSIEPEAEELTRILLSKSADTNVFIRQDAEKALTAMVQSVSPKHAMMALISGGGSHKSKDVRKVCARLLSQVAESIGSSRLLNGTKDITDRIVPTASQFALDGQQETRYYGRKMLFLMMEHPDFEKLLEKHVISKNLRPIKDLVQTLKNKGLGDPPNIVGSANVRKSVRQSDSAAAGNRRELTTDRNEVSRSSAFRNGNGTMQGTRVPSHKTTRRRSKDESTGLNMSYAKALDMDLFAKLTSSDWKERLEGIETLNDVVESNPNAVAASIVKVFDRYGPRLADSNSKVLVYALQTLSKIIPILRDGLMPVITLTIQNLQGCIASKNELVYTSASDALDTLVKYVDCIALVPPLLNAIQFGNSRVKPEMASRLAEIIPNVFSKKPGVINKSILPVFWNILNSSNAGSAGTGRNDLITATTKLANQLYICHGESLVEDAETQGSRVKQRLVYFLDNSR